MSPSLTRLLAAWRAEPTVGGNVAEWRSLPRKPADLAPLPVDLHPALAAALHRRGIQALYTHQAQAWEILGRGSHLMVTTGTASGKSLCYNLPVLQRLLSDLKATALYLFPTKALAQDQASTLREMEQLVYLWNDKQVKQLQDALHPVPLAIYDGDTPTSSRSAIRKSARLLISNPDMLHLGILPHHTTWADFLSGLRFVVLDEAHVYRGVFGSHVADVLRRLRRIAAFYGSRPQFVLTSATLANPGEFAARLVEAPVQVVEQDGAGRGPRHFLIYNPPVVDPDLGIRRSALQESVRLAEDLLAYDIQTILFARSRRSVELILTYLREKTSEVLDPLASLRARTSEVSRPFDTKESSTSIRVHPRPISHSNEEVRGYRSGYLPAQRREIERGLRQGQVRLVAATNALELGIDVGQMGAALLVGYPGTVAATRQQAGRAGRGDEPALAVLIATADPLDQFLARNPEYIFERPTEHALINPDNLLILLDHIRCAAFELPFQPGEAFGSLSGEATAEFLEFLAAEGSLHHSGERYFWMADQYPAQRISLRSASANPVLLQCEQDGHPQVIGQIDRDSAVWMVHPGAVYLHEAQMFVVESLDLENNLALLGRSQSDYYTQAQRQTELQLVELHTQTESPAAITGHGDVLVTSTVVGFQKIRWYTHEILGVEPLEMPRSELLTTGYWLAIKEDAVEELRQAGLWRGDPNDYGPEWPRLRQAVRARDSYRCQMCGAPEAAGRSHDVHHKTPFRSFFSRPDFRSLGDFGSLLAQANRMENLITLCPACHRQAETAVRMRSGLSGLAHVFGSLAPFFLMCDPGDLGVYYDPQSPFPGEAGGAADPRPTVALYDQAPGGIGLSQRLFELHSGLVARAADLVAGCSCADGCPSCTGPGGENGMGGKQETLAILKLLRGKDEQ